VDGPLAGARLDHRCDEQVGAEHVLVVDVPGGLVVGEVEEHAGAWAGCRAVGGLGELVEVGAQAFAQEEV
jgi:hypothetical protein